MLGFGRTWQAAAWWELNVRRALRLISDWRLRCLLAVCICRRVCCKNEYASPALTHFLTRGCADWSSWEAIECFAASAALWRRPWAQ